MSSKRSTNRRSSPTTATTTGSAPPSSHALENSLSHRQFLIRSLDRCDADLAAVNELNQTLRQSKQRVIETCGESTLLDLGEGKIKMSVDESCLVVASAGVEPTTAEHTTADNHAALVDKQQEKEPSSADKRKKKKDTKQQQQQETIAPVSLPPEGEPTLVCMDFLWRLKLRRKLLNRLARRLLRLATAMDGNSADGTTLPPGPPKFGDLRLHLDPAQISQFEERYQQQAAALKRMQERREGRGGRDADQEEEETPGGVVTETTVPVEEETTTTANVDSGADAPNDEPTAPKGQPTSAAAADAPDAASDDHHATRLSMLDPAALREYDYEVLRDYNDAYEKAFPTNGGPPKYTILDKPYEEDYHLIKYGAGIGAAHRSMSSKEKELEWKRWQTALLQRIPDQPTASELGVENRVFHLKERREHLEKEAERKAKAAKKKKAKKEAESMMDVDRGDHEDKMDLEEAEGKKKGGDEEYKEQDHNEEEEEEELPSPKNKRKRKKDQEETQQPVKITKFMSLAATPSFYEQDKKRLVLIHADLMATSITNYARRRVEQDTIAYNHAFRSSNDLYMRKMKTESEITGLAYEYRMKISKMMNDMSVSGAIYKARWKARKEAHDRQRAAQCMPSSYNRVPIGTPLSAEASKDESDASRAVVARTLSDMIDGVVTRTTDPNWKDTPFDEPFERPPTNDPNDAVCDPATGETFRQRQSRIEAHLKNKLVEISKLLAGAEETRKHRWKRMMKTKQEFDIPHQHITTSGGRRTQVRVDSRQLHLLPLPPLGPSSSSGMVATPSYAPSSMAAYTPPPVPQGPSLPPARTKIRSAYGMNSDSKYSAAQMMQRIGTDGTVAPVTEPKKGNDGLYQRPAGRSRIGMEWDALRGVWVPSANPTTAEASS
jgi:hypothetical protein